MAPLIRAVAAGRNLRTGGGLLQRVARMTDIPLPPCWPWRPTGGSAARAVRSQRRFLSLFAFSGRWRQCTLAGGRRAPPNTTRDFSPTPSAAAAAGRLASTTANNPAAPPVVDPKGTRDEAIRSPAVDLYDQNGKRVGLKRTLSVLSIMPRDKFTLVITECAVPKERKLPVAHVMAKATFLTDLREQEKEDKERRKLEPKEKILTIKATCDLVDVARKAKRMRPTLEKGDHVRVAVEMPKKKGSSKDRAQLELHTNRIWEFLKKEWADVAKTGATTPRARGGQEGLFKPIISKQQLYEQKKKK